MNAQPTRRTDELPTREELDAFIAKEFGKPIPGYTAEDRERVGAFVTHKLRGLRRG